MKILNVALLVAAVVVAGCSSSSNPKRGSAPEADEPNVEIEVARSAQQRNTDPQLSDVERDTLASSQAGFALDIYHAVRKLPRYADRDIFLSPHSVSIALAMTYAGARGDTAAEMKQALHFTLPDDRLHTAFNYLDLALANRGKDAEGKDGKPFRFTVTNSIWGQKGASFETPFLDSLATNYGAGLNIVDFIRAPDNSRVTINDWVAEKTEQRIKDILPESAVTPDTRLVLVNAVYFNAAWASKFEPRATKPAPFTRLDGSTADVPTMTGLAKRRHARGGGYEAVELPYDGDELSMLIIAPTAGTFATFESSLTGGKVLDILAGLQSEEVVLFLPKLKLDGAFDLKAPLKSLGMNQLFAGGADLSGMSRTEKLSVSDVFHKTFLELDENGTEAAAATAVVVTNSSAGPEPVVMKVDRPFLTAIVDRPTRTLVFLGRILEPKL